MRLAWMTDIHLNFLGTTQIEQFLQTIADQAPDAVLITGDIGEAPTLQSYLVRIADTLQRPIYFILGNHDYYHGTIASVRDTVTQLHRSNAHLHWLPLCDVVPLSDDTALVGHGGWSDGGYGDFMNSSVMLNDYMLIQDLKMAWMLGRDELHAKILELGQDAGDYLKPVLSQALNTYSQVVVALHSPPFQETAWHEGNTPTDDDPYLPHFTCKAIGDILLACADAHPDKQMTVLCGHTHGRGERTIRPNLQVITGGAVYEQPTVQRILQY